MATKANTAAKNEVLELLRNDHKKVKQAFRKFEELDVDEEGEAAQELVTQTCAELTVHATIEEEFFYPAAREALSDVDILAEAEVEHAGAKMLIEKLKTLGPEDEAFKASFTVLGEYIKHHVKEEEGEMFDQLERARIDWESVKGQMMARRQELMVELGLEGPEVEEAEGEEEDEETDMTSARGSKRQSSTRGSQQRSASKSARSN